MWNHWLMTASVPETYSARKGKAYKWGTKKVNALYNDYCLALSVGKPGKHSLLWCRPWLTIIDGCFHLFAHSWDSKGQSSFFRLFSLKCDKHVSSYLESFARFLPCSVRFIINLSSVGVQWHPRLLRLWKNKSSFYILSCGQCENTRYFNY